MHELIVKLGGDNGIERERARKALVKMGRDSIDFLQVETVKSLEEIADPVSIPLLTQAVEDDKSDVRWIAAKGLIKLGEHSIKPLLKILEHISDSVFILEGAHHVFLISKKIKSFLKTFLLINYYLH